MPFQKLLYFAAGLGLLYLSHRTYGWPGVAAVAGGLTMWLLLHFNRFMAVLRRASERPIGHVGSAVMLNVKLKPGATLMHVMAITRSLGERLSDEGAQPEIYRWRDNGDSTVTAEFQNGKLARWKLERPDPEAAPASGGAADPGTGGPTS
ncbi:glycerate kinase [Hydrogenophaga palleronii]|uniref:glycerate kinase n=1 Tax=Hydrogenophaga palleronii TaxID=65655 RepID=UPI000826D432|nr:glycerate kinase [Hydrogenophaga palleronii]